MSRQTLRAATLGSSVRPANKTIAVEVDGVKHTFEVRTPSIAERGQIMKAGGYNADGTIQSIEGIFRAQCVAIIKLAVDPDSGERVFEDADIDDLLAQPAGGWVDRLGRVAIGMLNVQEDVAGN